MTAIVTAVQIYCTSRSSRRSAEKPDISQRRRNAVNTRKNSQQKNTVNPPVITQAFKIIYIQKRKRDVTIKQIIKPNKLSFAFLKAITKGIRMKYCIKNIGVKDSITRNTYLKSL